LRDLDVTARTPEMGMSQSVAYGPSLVDEQGAIELPADLRRRFGIEPGSSVIIEERAGGILIRPAYPPVEIYTPERVAEFLLSTTVDAEDYADAVAQVRKMGLSRSTELF
jgi:AbrB family looped-hinge helix DNA binding protein